MLHPLLRTASLLALILIATLRCSDTTPNPRSLWINYSQREIDLQLIDYEPPPF